MPTTPSSILALDVGEQRVGVAYASMAARLASPLTTLPNDASFMPRLQALIAERAVDTVVVGLPRGLEGQSTPQTEQVRAFADNLQKRTQLPVILQDEALTSVKAEQELRGRRRAYTKEDIDSLSATYILEDYLREGHL